MWRLSQLFVLNSFPSFLPTPSTISSVDGFGLPDCDGVGDELPETRPG
jgi:hypothetical protein